jgi:uncharacterized protein (DUF1810 family)
MTDPFDLNRFVQAQNPVFRAVQGELAVGRKQTHWMWFVFPQVAGLGLSTMSRRYAIGSQAEAMAYLAHPVLGSRLLECTRLVLAVEGRTINAILGSPDDAKFRSSMTLFGAVSDKPVFGDALARYFAGERDDATLEILAKLDQAER